MSAGKSASSVLGKVALLVGLLVAFGVGLFGTIKLALYNPAVKVPNVVGKDRMTGESELESGGLNLRVRMTRYVPDKAPNTILDQSPHPDEVVKKGQTIAVVLARAPKENEAPPDELADDDEETTDNANANTSGNSSNSNGNVNRKKSDSKNKSDNKNANNRNKNSNSAKSTNKNGNKNSNANNANSSGSNKNANNNKPAAKNANASNANSGNRNRRTTPEP